MKVLETEHLSASYESVRALRDVNISVEEGEIVAIIGANGAGKTTLLSCISGLMPFMGNIMYRNEKFSGIIDSHAIILKGVVQVPEGRQIFSELSVMDNLRMGAYIQPGRNNINREIRGLFSQFPILEERKHQKGGDLSGGEQQMLAFARALLAKPKLLLLDEPSMGLSPVIVANIFRIIQRLHDEGITIILIEQNAQMALKISSRAYVLETGKIQMSGKSEVLAIDEKVKTVYLGV